MIFKDRIMNLKGHVDRVDKFLIAGWALCVDDPLARPTINIIQLGETLFSFSPNFEAPLLRAALDLPPVNIPPLYAWRLWLPLANGLKPDIPFSLIFQDTNEHLTLGSDRVVQLMEFADKEAINNLSSASLMFPFFTLSEGKLDIFVTVEAPKCIENPALLVNNSYVIHPIDRVPAWLNKISYSYRLSLLLSSEHWKGVDVLEVKSSCCPADLSMVYRLMIPRSIYNHETCLYPVPLSENIGRISGPMSDQAQYLIGGITTFAQIESILRIFFEKGLSDFRRIVDWGVGCGRIIRHFYESTQILGFNINNNWELLGVDIDPVNIAWCKTNFSEFACFDLLPLTGFDIESGSVDLVYGISVFTHLSEYEQHRWLSEIKRITRKGSAIVLTTHGEGIFYRECSNIALPFADKFDFFDGIPDAAIGTDRDKYYRASYHSQRYIKEYWSKYFRLISILPQANAFRQDFVVLERT